MTLLWMLLLALATLLAAAVLYAQTQPATFRIARSARICAPPERIFPLINSLRQMNTWMPFVKPDPEIRMTYSGPDSGVGAVNDFSGNRQVGAGRVEITGSNPPRSVDMRLVMTRPMSCDNRIAFTLEPSGDATEVTWAMSGPTTFLGRLMCLAFDPEKMVGSTFEKGLADLKALAEG